MKQRIKEFLQGNDEDYFGFIKTLSDRKVNPFFNTEKKGDFVESWYPRLYMSKVTGKDLNIIYNAKEVDFTKFSWTFVKIHSKDQELLDIIKNIDELNEEIDDHQFQFRLKRLRIQIFTTMNYVGSPFFNVEVYKRCTEDMYHAMETLNGFLEGNVKKISTTYDSVLFLGNFNEEALRQVLVPADYKVRHYEMIVRHRNVMAYKYKGVEWRLKRINGTKYDNHKEKVIEFLKELKFTDAIMYLNKTDLNPKTKGNYIKDVVAAARCPKCKKQTIFPCIGGTCKIPNPEINWMCKTCLHEW